VSLRAQYWRVRYGRWPARPPHVEGYTVLVPVPGDLPAFLELAIAVLKRQDHSARVATFVVPDRMTPAMDAVVAKHASAWPDELRIVTVPRPERWFAPRLRSVSRRHGVQVLAGVSAAPSTHVLFHDADLFLFDRDALESRYRTCRERGLACLGVDPVWDGWYARHGRRLAATWEMCADVEWMRSWPPHLHMNHDAELWGERHAFDTTLHPQALTGGDLIDVAPVEGGLVHFNYVVSTYRLFQRHGPGMLDDKFRLLLVRLFVDAFSPDDTSCEVPPMAELADGLGREGAVRYPTPMEGADDYAHFRAQLEGVLSGPWISPDQCRAASDALCHFDEYYRVG
jgi:hypothetical protein